MAQVLQVPITFPDLRHRESYLQLFDSLDELNRVVDEVFNRVVTRVKQEKERLGKVDQRLNIAQGKVTQIAGNHSKATTVLSPAKYPSPEHLSSYEPLYSEPFKRPIKHSSFKLAEVPHGERDFFFDTLSADSLPSETVVKTEQHEVATDGLGRLPRHLPSVSSLLLFNTPENPYKKYVSLDNLAGKEPEKKEDSKKKKKKELSEAPKTFIEGDKLPAVAIIEYNYRPKLEDVPEMNLPSFLPNLPNVADLTWSGANVLSIAPSSDLIPSELPVAEIIPSIPGVATPAPRAPAIDVSILPVTNVEPGPPAPPPPPPPMAPLPPPPPMTPMAPPPPPSMDLGAANLPPIDDGRTNLLSDIRKGLKLKSVKDRKVSKKAEAPKSQANKKAAPAPTGDIFSDLIVALNRRRVGIAEKQKEATQHALDEEKIVAPPETADEEWAP